MFHEHLILPSFVIEPNKYNSVWSFEVSLKYEISWIKLICKVNAIIQSPWG